MAKKIMSENNINNLLVRLFGFLKILTICITFIYVIRFANSENSNIIIKFFELFFDKNYILFFVLIGFLIIICLSLIFVIRGKNKLIENLEKDKVFLQNQIEKRGN